MAGREDLHECYLICVKHSEMENRVETLESQVKGIKDNLKEREVGEARIERTLEMVTQTLFSLQNDTKELRKELLSLVSTTLKKSQDDISNFIKMADKGSQVDKYSTEKEKAFYRKIIIACISIGGTIVLVSFGIKQLIPLF